MNSPSSPLARRLADVRSSPALSDPTARLVVTRAGPDAYAALARFHYRAGPPPRAAAYWRFTDPADPETPDQPVAVLAVARPVLNAPWRPLAWPGRFDSPDPRDRAVAINRDLRVISRVLVDPRWRALGLASRLLRAYLADPLTPCTEALAAMGALCPLFERAGMRPVPVPPSRRNRRLLALLAQLNLEPHRLACPAALAPPLLRALERPIRAWTADSKATRKLKAAPLETLLPLAASGLTPLLAYVAEAPSITEGIFTSKDSKNTKKEEAGDPDQKSDPTTTPRPSPPPPSSPSSPSR